MMSILVYHNIIGSKKKRWYSSNSDLFWSYTLKRMRILSGIVAVCTGVRNKL